MKKIGRRKSQKMTRANQALQGALTGVMLATSVIAAAPLMAGAQGQDGGRHEGDRRDGDHRSELPAQRFDIAAGSLQDVLGVFKSVTGVDLDVHTSLRGLKSEGVSGEFTPEEALRRILEGTPVRFRFIAEKKVAIGRAPNGPRGRGRVSQNGETEATLEGVTVNADRASRVASPKYSAPLRDIPQSITVIPKDVIENQGATSLRDVVRNVTGLTINAGEGGATPGDKFNLRGFSAANDIFIDGVRDVSGYSRETFNIEQVEVSKGPNSSVNGRGSTGGSINLVTKAPGLTANRVVSVSGGTADQLRGTIDINQPLAPLGEPGAAFRFNAVASKGGIPGLDVVERKSWGYAPSLTVGLDGPTQLNLAYTRSAQDNIPSYGIESFAGVPTFDTRNYFGLRSVDFEHVDADQFTVKIDHDFRGIAQIRNQFTRGHSKSDRIVTPAVPAPATNPDSARRAPKSHINDNDVLINQTNISSSFRTGGVGHSVAAGFEVSKESSLWGRYTITGAIPAISNLNNPPADANFHPAMTATVTRQVQAHAVGAYLFETANIGDKVEISANLRWDQYTPKYINLDTASVRQGFKAAKSSAVSGRGGIVFKPTEEGSIYAAYGTSFNPSSENLSADAASAATSLPPEKNRSYEVGTKWDLFKKRLQATLALFRTDKVNARTSDPANTGLGTILAGKQRVQGGEVGLNGNVTSKWNVFAGYSNLHARYLESANAAQEGTSLTNVPKNSVNVWTTYQISEHLSIGGGARYMDRRLLRTTTTAATQTTPAINTQVYVPSYHTYDAVASYQLTPSVDLRLNAYNLTDKLYYDSGRMWVPAAGRSVLFTTSVKL